MSQTIPRVPHTTVHLDRGLTHMTSRAGAIGFGSCCCKDGFFGLTRIDGPSGKEGDAPSTLKKDLRIGQQML